MKKLLLVMIFLSMAGLPAFADSFNVFLGYAVPSGKSDVFTQNVRETTFRVSDLDNWEGTFGYDHFFGDYFNLGFSTTYYHDDTHVQDVDFIYPDGSPIFRRIHLQIVPLEANLHVLPIGRDRYVIPYGGGGFGVYFWNYEEAGDFVIDRFTAHPSVITGHAFSDGADPGWHAEGGIMIPFSHSTTFNAEVKYWHAHGHLDVTAFDPNFHPLDLSTTVYQGGVSFWF